jgi:iron complex transport system ATP-binding protein
VKPLTLDRLSVSLDGVRVVAELGLEVEPGEWVVLIGPNGAGKTTVLRAVAGLVAYTGLVRLFGKEVSGLPRPDVARRVALVPQNPVIPVDMTVLEYTLLGRTPHLGFLGSPGAADVRSCRSALGRLDAAHLIDRRLGSLSGGERQRAVLARALAQDARLVLFDEPTAALDVGAQQQVLELVAGLRSQGNLTVLSAMHDLTVAGQYADRLVLLDGGHEVAAGTPGEVLTEDLIARHYGASVRVVVDPDTGVAVVPLRPRLEAEEHVG